ncbi:acyl-CoA dehydrogenase family protein [Nocardia sp. alder85J]|uniref:acyl-CoA dehydrogenase family protein n=1 Tax=Nocardia sp. alder85J TaxID=2862949 RepID=UPI001CD1CE6B|nr:acyl-CoA dehydrogenase family protein [Nocardia sp. alder85J]MCX4092355.1 acyl-CoA/acyl-ACP dehydrogenase [Nocardia sp. alder85J]
MTMEIEPAEDQRLLLDTSARFIDDALPLTAIRALADGAPADLGHVPAAAELGWFAMFVDESLGGGSVSGDPVTDAVLLALLRGGRLLPEPFVAGNAVAAAVAAAGSDAQRRAVLPELAAGKTRATLAVTGDALWGGTTLLAEAAGADLTLTGSVIVDDAAADWIVVTALSGEEAVPVLLETGALPAGRPLACLDLTRRLERITLDGVRVPRTAVLTGAVERLRTVAALLAVAGTVGALDRLFELTRQYSLDRFAFGRPIGSFQGLKHLMADMSAVVESMRAVLAGATRAVAADLPYAAETVAIANTYAGERTTRLVQDCQQVYGGIGFAWEHDLHLYLRRAATDVALYGSTDFHRGRILAAHAEEWQEAR